jgi:hypothetical protein
MRKACSAGNSNQARTVGAGAQEHGARRALGRLPQAPVAPGAGALEMGRSARGSGNVGA